MAWTPQQAIERRITVYRNRENRIQARINFLAVVRIAVFLVTLVGGALVFSPAVRWLGLPAFFGGAGVFLYLMVVHDRCYRFREWCRFMLRAAENDLARVTGRLADVNVTAPIDFPPDHPFAHDLDFGTPYSVLKLIDNCYHQRTKALLRQWIDGTDSAAAIEARQAAIADLAPRARLRARFSLAAWLDSRPDLDPNDLGAWLREPEPWTLGLPAYLFGRLSAALALLYFALLVIVNSPALVAPGDALFAYKGLLDSLFLPVLGWQFGVFAFFDFFQKRFYAAFMQRGRTITAVCAVMSHFERLRPNAPLLQAIQTGLAFEGQSATERLRLLLTINEKLQYRSNGFAHVLLNVICLWDQHQLRRLAGWRRRFGQALPQWGEQVFPIEALSALANFHRLFPEYPFPNIVDADAVHIEATAMAHPGIRAQDRVGNDYQLQGNGLLHLVTGSNMSGKSTFLRTCGVNLVLARLGAPVCAEALTCSVPRLWTSIRIQDSLAEGVSYFYAEVKRIKLILDEIARDETPAFYLLDEILKGTNSRERLIACRAMVDFLIQHKASGLITTHDLELISLEGEYHGEILNYHFQEHIQDESMFFDYRLKRGQLTSTNALRVLRFAEVPLDFARYEAGSD